jgi:hypothetical protein
LTGTTIAPARGLFAGSPGHAGNEARGEPPGSDPESGSTVSFAVFEYEPIAFSLSAPDDGCCDVPAG